MSRSGYSYECEPWELIRWRGAVMSAIRGKRGQAFLSEMLQALDAMPEKRLITGALIEDGQVCALGAVGQRRGMAIEDIDVYDREGVANLFGIAEAMAAEIMEENDHGFYGRHASPEERWSGMRRWVESQIQVRT